MAITKHNEVNILPYSRSFVYNVVANVDKYPSFIPWISNVKVLAQYHNIVDYEMSINFKIFEEKFCTRDVFNREESIIINGFGSGPFSYLYNTWNFYKLSDNTTKVEFYIEFEFKSKILSLMFSRVFIEAQKKIINAFNQEVARQNKLLLNK